MKNQEIVTKLISVGKKITDSISPDISSLARYDYINRIGPTNCEKVASHLSNEDLIYLIKGIIYVERKLKWTGGSVASGILFFKMLIERNVSINKIDEISAWIIKNTKNPYSPFGTLISMGAKNYSEYKNLSHKRQLLIQYELEQDKKFEKEAKKQREMRKRIRSYSAKCRNSPKREDLIKSLNGMSIRDQLILISKDEKYLPNFYPTKCADSADLTVIKSLPEEVIYALANKMKGKYRGPWGAFKKRLLFISGPVRKKKPWSLWI